MSISTEEFQQQVKDLIAVKGIKTKLPSVEHLLAIIEALSDKIMAQKSIEWYETRFGTIGASEIGHLIHYDGKYDNGFFKIPMDRYAPEPFDADGEYNCGYGNFFEEVTRLVFEDINDVRVLETGSIEGFCPNQRFSPDGLAVDKDGTPIICEFKTPPKRNFVPGYISDVYREQVLAGLFTLYAKYKVKAKGMFMDCFLKNCYLDQLRPNDRSANFDQKRVYQGNNYKTFGGAKAMYMGLVEIVPKDKHAFVNFLINSENDEILRVKKIIEDGEADDISEAVPPHSEAVPPHSEAVPPHSEAVQPHSEAVQPHSEAVPPHGEAVPDCPLGDNDSEDERPDFLETLFEEFETRAASNGNDYISDLGVIHKRSKFEGVVDPQRYSQFCDILSYIYKIKAERDEIKRKILFGGDKVALEAQLDAHQDIEIIYHPLDVIKPENAGFYIGYKVFRVNPITIELDYSTLREDIKIRSERVAHTRAMMDVFNQYIDDCKAEKLKPTFNRKVMKCWFKKTAGKGCNDPCKIPLDVLEDALYDNVFSNVAKDE